jgi:hypothetical protein
MILNELLISLERRCGWKYAKILWNKELGMEKICVQAARLPWGVSRLKAV